MLASTIEGESPCRALIVRCQYKEPELAPVPWEWAAGQRKAFRMRAVGGVTFGAHRREYVQRLGKLCWNDNFPNFDTTLAWCGIVMHRVPIARRSRRPVPGEIHRWLAAMWPKR